MDKKLPYYCSQKFTYLTVDVDKRTTKSCCDVPEVKIDLTWLKNNPGNIFNNETYVNERKDMLEGKKLESCRHCWINEESGIPSRREISKTTKITHQNLTNQPKMINIDLGHECNMSCVYCNTHNSTAWLREVKQHGKYSDNRQRFVIHPIDVVLSKFSLREKQQLDSSTLIIDEVKKFKNLDSIEISGGEPFLYNNLVDLCQSVTSKEIKVITGLGVNPKRFQKILERLPKETIIGISGESVGRLYEFVRHGNSYENFLKNLKTVEKMGFNHYFSSAIGNLTVHGYREFQKIHGTDNDKTFFISSPNYLTIDLIDNESKQKLLDQDFGIFDSEIKLALNNTRKDEEDRLLLCKKFVSELVERRKLSLDVFPNSFIEYLTS
jgi:organic radical activating enzyme